MKVLEIAEEHDVDRLDRAADKLRGQAPGEVRGVMEVGTRRARVPEARIVGLWLGPRMSDELAASVADRYRDVRIFRSRDELLTSSR